MRSIALGLEDLHGSSEHLLGDIYALLSAVFLGIYFLITMRILFNIKNWNIPEFEIMNE